MIVTLKRVRENPLSTVGELSIGADNPIAVVLEDGFHSPKIAGETRIPSGEYELKLRNEGAVNANYFERFGGGFHKGMLWLQDVPDFKYVLIHCGNTVKDTEGCLLVGSSVVEAKPGQPFAVKDSEKAYRKVYPLIAAALIAGEKVSIVVQAAAPAAAPPAVA